MMRRQLVWAVLAVVIVSSARHAQTGTITGHVVDTTDAPIAGVRVALAQNGQIAWTDSAGIFSLPFGGTRVRAPHNVGAPSVDVRVVGGTLRVEATGTEILGARLHDLAGRHVELTTHVAANMGRFQTMGPAATGLYLLDIRTTIGLWPMHVMVAGMGRSCSAVAKGAPHLIGSLARGVALDSLAVSKRGYNGVTIPVGNILGDLPRIVLTADRIEHSIDSLLALMTNDEKAGQMIQADHRLVLDNGDVSTMLLGSVITGVGTMDFREPSEWADNSDATQTAAASTRLGIPILQGTDAVHGHNNCRSAVIFPHNVGMGCTRNPSLVEQQWEITALEAAGTGVNWTFGPCVAVVRDERWGRTYEGFGESPALADSMAAAAVRGLQKAGAFTNGAIAACVKHYLADGGTAWATGRDGKIDQGLARGGEAVLRELHLPPYVAAVREGAYSMMAQYGSWEKPDTTYAEDFHASYYWLTQVLKRELGFDGIVLTDCQGYNTIGIHESVADTLRERVRATINAGVDMLMACSGYRNTLDRLKSLINGGEIPMARVNDAVRRILRVKYHLGLFADATVDRAKTAAIGSAAHRAVARQAVRESCVLMKNDNNRLPLRKNGQKIAVIGAHADSVALVCGGWSMGWANAVEPIVGTTVLDGIKALIGDTADVIYSAMGAGITDADIAVVVSGEMPYAEWFGDNANPRLPNWTRQQIDNCYSAGKPVVLVLISGRPLLFEGYEAKCDAIVAAWLPGTEADGIADVLFGDYAPTGRLAHSWPRELAQIPINLGDPGYDPLYPYGYGLTY